MRNASKRNWPATLMLFLGLTSMVPASFSFTTLQAVTVAAATCTPPQPVVNGYSSGYVSFTWQAVDGATTYQVYYTRQEDNYTSSTTTTGATTISYSNLPHGTYDFYFRSVCGGDVSSFIIEDDLIM